MARMPVELSGRLVFLASPGGLQAERERCRSAIRDYNETHGHNDGVAFIVHAWEDVPGGIGRPQDLINPRLDECDYALILFGEWWGSPPASDGPYTSGTEEEFFRALDLLSQPDAPMRDILVLFKGVSPERLRDPGESLRQVLNFRARLEASRTLMYEAFDSLDDLELRVTRKLREWSGRLETKEARTVEIPQASVDTSDLASRDRGELLDIARRHAADGMLLQAEAAFAGATQDGDARSLLEFAQFMRRTGRLERALELNHQVVDNTNLLKSQAASAVGARVSAMANIGVIQRKRGELTQSLASLREAVETASKAPDPLYAERCYALDNYGLSLLQAGRAEAAFEQFALADNLRAERGTAAEQAQSAINLARQHMYQLRMSEARELFKRALTLLEGAPDDLLKANAEAGLAEALIRADDDGEAEPHLRAAMELNTRAVNSDGLSIVHCLMARSRLKLGDLADADRHIAEASSLVAQAGNVQGRCVVAWLRAESARRRGAVDEAKVLLAVAEQACGEFATPSLLADIVALRTAVHSA